MLNDLLVLIAILAASAAAGQLMPGYLGMPAGLFQERMMLALLPVLALFLLSAWKGPRRAEPLSPSAKEESGS